MRAVEMRKFKNRVKFMEAATSCVRIRCPFRLYRGFKFYVESGLKNPETDCLN